MFNISRAVSLRCESRSAGCSLVALLWLWLGQISLNRGFSNDLLGQTHTGEIEGSIQPLDLLVVLLTLPPAPAPPPHPLILNDIQCPKAGHSKKLKQTKKQTNQPKNLYMSSGNYRRDRRETVCVRTAF